MAFRGVDSSSVHHLHACSVKPMADSKQILLQKDPPALARGTHSRPCGGPTAACLPAQRGPQSAQRARRTSFGILPRFLFEKLPRNVDLRSTAT